MKLYFQKHFKNPTLKMKIINSLRHILAICGLWWIVPGLIDKEF